MNRKGVAFLIGTMALSTLAAWHRWPDSAHAIGIVKRWGGSTRHPVSLEGGLDRYAVVATATVIPPYRGDVAFAIEGEPPMGWGLEVSRPAVDLGLHSWPTLEGDTLRGLEPRDRLALWVTLRPPWADPVCGMACGDGALRASAGDREECFCSGSCRERFLAEPGRFPPRRVATGRWALVLRDRPSGQPVLSVPILLGGKEAGHGAAHH